MTRSKLSGGVINVVEGDPEIGTITYMSVACVDGTLRKYVGRLTPCGQSNVETVTFKEYLVYKYCEALGDPELVDRHIRICKAMLGQCTDDRLTATTLREHLEWVANASK